MSRGTPHLPGASERRRIPPARRLQSGRMSVHDSPNLSGYPGGAEVTLVTGACQTNFCTKYVFRADKQPETSNVRYGNGLHGSALSRLIKAFGCCVLHRATSATARFRTRAEAIRDGVVFVGRLHARRAPDIQIC